MSDLEQEQQKRKARPRWPWLVGLLVITIPLTVLGAKGTRLYWHLAVSFWVVWGLSYAAFWVLYWTKGAEEPRLYSGRTLFAGLLVNLSAAAAGYFTGILYTLYLPRGDLGTALLKIDILTGVLAFVVMVLVLLCAALICKPRSARTPSATLLLFFQELTIAPVLFVVATRLSSPESVTAQEEHSVRVGIPSLQPALRRAVQELSIRLEAEGIQVVIVEVPYENAEREFCLSGNAPAKYDAMLLHESWMASCRKQLAVLTLSTRNALVHQESTPPQRIVSPIVLGRQTTIALPVVADLFGLWVRQDWMDVANGSIKSDCVQSEQGTLIATRLLDPSCYQPDVPLPIGIAWNHPWERVDAFLQLYRLYGGTFETDGKMLVGASPGVVERTLAALGRLLGTSCRSSRTTDQLRHEMIQRQDTAISVGWISWAAADNAFWNTSSTFAFHPLDPSLSGHWFVGVPEGRTLDRRPVGRVVAELANTPFQINELSMHGLVPVVLDDLEKQTTDLPQHRVTLASARMERHPDIVDWTAYEQRISLWLHARLCAGHNPHPPFELRE